MRKGQTGTIPSKFSKNYNLPNNDPIETHLNKVSAPSSFQNTKHTFSSNTSMSASLRGYGKDFTYFCKVSSTP